MRLGLERGMFRPGERVCAAVSGGADSVALLRALVEANGEERGGLGVGLSAVHVHHGLRGEAADGDAAFVRELCAGLGVRLLERAVDVPARVLAEKETVEEAARELRYGVFGELMASGEADVVATAHTLDDQAETVLMKLLRGTGMEGLGGISPVVEEGGGRSLQTYVPKNEGHGTPVLVGARRFGRIVRPLLGVRRSEIEGYLRSLGQGWREDETNTDVAYTRNRVRHELMPVLRGFNPEVEQALAHLAEIAREEEERWRGEMARLLPQVLLPGKPVRGGGRAAGLSAKDGGGVAVDLARLKGVDRATRRRVVRAAAKQVGVGMHFDETERVLRLAGLDGEGRQGGEQKGGGRRLELHGGLRVERSARELRFWC